MHKTTLEIDEELLEKAKKATGHRTAKAVVNEGLKALIRQSRLDEIAALEGSGFLEMTQEDLRILREDG